MKKTKVTETIIVDSNNTFDLNVLLLNDKLLLDTPKHFVFKNNKTFNNVTLKSNGKLSIPLDLPKEITTILVIGVKTKTPSKCKVIETINQDTKENSVFLNDVFNVNSDVVELFTLTKEKQPVNHYESDWYYTRLNIDSDKTIKQIVGTYYTGILIK